MKQFVAILFVAVAALALTEAVRVRRDDKYTTKYDNINLDDIIASDRLLDNYIKCLLDTGKCTPEGTELKSHITDALENDCGKCSEVQRAGADKIIKVLYNKKPDQWKLLQTKYDPNDTYAKKYEAKLKEITA